jgi:2-phospho-L-lactate/phosphoenolpyruvate guanylyltransferase
MNTIAIIPARDPLTGKSRLAGLFNSTERVNFNLRLFNHVLNTTLAIFGRDTIVVSNSSSILEIADANGVHPIFEAMGDLNKALDIARTSRLVQDYHSLLTIATDLPFLAKEDLEGMLACRHDPSEIVIAPDHTGEGTNSILIPVHTKFPFLFGVNSRTEFKNAAVKLGMTIREFHSLGLSRDIDTPDDLAWTIERLGPPDKWFSHNAENPGSGKNSLSSPSL